MKTETRSDKNFISTTKTCTHANWQKVKTKTETD